MENSVNSVQTSSDFVKDYVCSACESTNYEESADIFCETCTKFYCGKYINQHDQLFKNHSKFGRGETNKWPLTKKMEDLLLTCDIHNKKLNMFCQDHDRLCCSDCVLLNHRQCTKVALISESVKMFSFDMQQLSISLQTILNQLNMFKRTQEASIKCVDVSYGEKLQEIRDMRNKLNATLDELENTTLKKLDEIRSTLQTSLKEDVENCRRLKDKLQQLSEAVQNLGEKSNNEIQFTACRKCLEKIQESETFLKENPVKGLNTMKFQANIDIQQYLSKNSCLGRFVVMNPNQVLTVKRKSEYNVKRSNDTSSTCFIVGICSLPTGHVIVVDHNNKRVKLFDQQFNLVSYFEMSGQLRDVCQITSSEVAVTVESCVQFICVKDGQLVNGGRLNLRHRAVGIAHHYGQLYVTSSTALYHYTMSGTLVKMLYEDTGGGCRVFKCAVSPAGDRIYVTNCNQHTLPTLAMDGNLISTFTDTQLQEPWGVHVTNEGQVLVCGSSSNTVIQVDREGGKKLATLLSRKDVRRPLSVCSYDNIDQITVGLDLNNKIIVLERQ